VGHLITMSLRSPSLKNGKNNQSHYQQSQVEEEHSALLVPMPPLYNRHTKDQSDTKFCNCSYLQSGEEIGPKALRHNPCVILEQRHMDYCNMRAPGFPTPSHHLRVLGIQALDSRSLSVAAQSSLIPLYQSWHIR
jgi:hypothetical protein